MKSNIKLILFLLFTLPNSLLYSQNGWEIMYETQNQEWLYEVQFVNGSTGYIGASQGKLFKTTNSGLNWTVINYNTALHFNSIFFLDAQTGFYGGDHSILFKTTNGGVSADTMKIPGPENALHSVFFPSRDTGYIASKCGGLYKTTNKGLNWIILRPPYSGFYFEGLHCVNNNIVFATGINFINYTQIIRTTNGGISFDSIRVDSAADIYGVYFTDENTGFIASYRQTGQPNSYYTGLIYKSTNGGTNWTQKLADSSSVFWTVRFLNHNTGYVVGTMGSTFAKTTDAGETWKVYKSYLFGGLYSVYFINANTGIACGYFSIIRTTNGGEPIGIKQISNEVPSSFSLSQNYPNPFNPATKIKFDIPFSHLEGGKGGDYVKLLIYDALGHEISILLNEKLKAGTYEVEWNASGYPSGVYFYQLKTEEFTDTKKMILLK